MPPANKKNVKKSTPATKSKKTTSKTVTPAQTIPAPAPAPVPEPVAPVTTEAPVVSDTPYLEEFSAVVSALDEAMITIRGLRARLQKLEKQVHRDTKALNKKASGKRARKPRDPNAPKSGFAKEGPVSDEMRKFLGLKKDELISRTDVTKRIHEYCKTKNLQNPDDKRHIKADASLRKLLKMNKDDDLTFFNLQKFMKVHFPNKDGVFPTA
uniref:Uncharacterized protein n=1 Tax=viral metagenome TaxID=1070528 RepID=A0A6C0FDP5_9ZZZZ|tara:strand:+ start:2542 stop:3174 length:633 start_codon:yes stop_codon:yes gene_type:complete